VKSERGNNYFDGMGCDSVFVRKSSKQRALSQIGLLFCLDGLSAIVGAFDRAGLVHPKRKLARVAVAHGFCGGDVAFSVRRDRDANVVSDRFRVTRLSGDQIGRNQGLKIAESAVVLRSVKNLHSYQSFYQILNVALMFLDQRIEKKSAACLLDYRQISFVANDPNTARTD
jgi:hypothetical protein